jgi:hypothetical protein
MAVLFLPLSGCRKLAGFFKGGGLSKIAPVLSAVTGSRPMGPGPTFGSQTGGTIQPARGSLFPGFGSPAGNRGGGLGLLDALGGSGPSANGVLNRPVMAQSSGGSEAAVRGCGPTSLLMATGRANPSEIQPVLVQTCERPGGLVAGRAVSWLRANGYPRSEHSNGWTVDMLRAETMDRGNPVLVNYVSPRTGNGHIVVVTGVTNQGIHVNDPGPGARRVIPVDQFRRQWAGRNEWAIPVRA